MILALTRPACLIFILFCARSTVDAASRAMGRAA
jgi:hypothetical protein